MRVLFVQTNTNTFLHALPIGPAMVASRLTRDGHEVRFVDLMHEPRPAACAAAAARAFAPNLVCYSVRNRDNQSLARYVDPMPGNRAVVDAVRAASEAPSLLGGTAFTTFPRRVLDALAADYGIAGDDLEPVSRFVRSLEAGDPDLCTPGLVFRRGGEVIENPWTIAGYRGAPCDHHALIDRARYRKAMWQAAVITRSGCPEACAYCDTYRTFGRAFVLRDPAEVAAEMLQLKREGQVRAVWLVDAGFNRPLDHARDVLREIIRQGAQMSIYCIVDPGPTDPEFFHLLKRAGGALVTLFADSLSEPVLRALDKPFGLDDVLRAAREARASGVPFMLMPTLGGPGETRETVRETLALLPRTGAGYSAPGIGWRILPGTPLRERAVREGLLAPDDDCWEPRFYLSPETPQPWLDGQVRAFTLRHPAGWWRMALAMARTSVDRPWRRGPESA